MIHEINHSSREKDHCPKEDQHALHLYRTKKKEPMYPSIHKITNEEQIQYARTLVKLNGNEKKPSNQGRKLYLENENALQQRRETSERKKNREKGERKREN